MKRAVSFVFLLIAAPAFAEADCKTVLQDIRNQDQLVKKQGAELSARYGDLKPPDEHTPLAVKREFVERLGAYIANVRRDIDDLRWLVDHHCGPANLEPGAIESMRDMEAAVRQLTDIRDKFVKREGL